MSPHLDKIIVHMGEVWKVIGVGAQRKGNTYCHLVTPLKSGTNSRGKSTRQISDWIDTAVLEASKIEQQVHDR